MSRVFDQPGTPCQGNWIIVTIRRTVIPQTTERAPMSRITKRGNPTLSSKVMTKLTRNNFNNFAAFVINKLLC